MKKIILTKGKIALIDDEDFDYLSIFKWQFKIGKGKTTGYATRSEYLGKINGKYTNKTILMHKEIMNSFEHELDHIDGDGLNNQKLNLRPATSSQNAINRRKKINSASKYKGVYWHSRDKFWGANIKVGKRRIEGGRFSSEIDAALAYDKLALKHHGEFAKINGVQCGKKK